MGGCAKAVCESHVTSWKGLEQPQGPEVNHLPCPQTVKYEVTGFGIIYTALSSSKAGFMPTVMGTHVLAGEPLTCQGCRWFWGNGGQFVGEEVSRERCLCLGTL